MDTRFEAAKTDILRKHCGNRTNCSKKNKFLLYPQCFPLNQVTVPPFVHIFDIVSLFAAEFEEPEIGVSVKGLNVAKFTCDLVGKIVEKGENAGFLLFPQ